VFVYGRRGGKTTRKRQEGVCLTIPSPFLNDVGPDIMGLIHARVGWGKLSERFETICRTTRLYFRDNAEELHDLAGGLSLDHIGDLHEPEITT